MARTLPLCASGASLRSSYKFYAYAPYFIDVDINASTKVISIPEGEYAANENVQTEWATTLNTNDFSGSGYSSAEKSTDWMIAAVVSKEAGVTDKVEEQFSHTMSKLIVPKQCPL